ncbi:AMP-binding protein [Amycolatopsis acidiphila]|uniref:4-coumarate--CoA ligase family protein n=1 Tax=Amycolatopsis acidiphila TaxID=715473 RepID=A0A558A567_9PSEU|nr:AMP-binding protein [Amycolatopsis acidiphila]TVT19402.1 4-coumarate--CoA ligase family protein [Amycolatopsis acidiphila]UIJ56791.1 AMP-binding protein [Amycolatopsis acidiphila]GHG55087.1 putative acyl-CoA synthetase [Amycolatopsis acidiphila]
MLHRSPLPDIEIPDVTLTEYVIGGARRYGDKPALVDGRTGESITYAELRSSVYATAAGLAARGVGPGDVVALMSHNQPRYAVALHAVIATGAAVTPVNPVLTVPEVTRQLLAAKAKMLIASDEARDKAREAAAGAGVEDVLALTALPTGGTPPAPRPDPATTVAVLPFSSGTTGTAKGVRLTHRNLVANLAQTRAGWRVGPQDVQAAVLPFFHIYGHTIILNSGLLGGATVVTLPRFELAEYLRTLAGHRVTRAYFAPPMVLTLATAPEVDDYDLSSLRYALCGAAPLDVEVTERAEKRLGCLIRQGYGMTEASPGTHQVFDDAFATTPPGSIGVLSPNTEARLVRPGTDEDVAAGETGELLVRGPQVMAGYLDDPAATAATVTDGWLHTGDLLRVDADGVFWVVDRLKELIKYKGYQVAPAELESVLLTHPDVLDAAVVGVPHAEGGEAPKAFVVTARPVDADALMAFVAERVAPYKKVRFVEFVGEIPKSPTGKILRRLLK